MKETKKSKKFTKILDATLIILLCFFSYKCIWHVEKEFIQCKKEMKEGCRGLIENLSQQILCNILLNGFNFKNKIDSLKKNVNNENSIKLIDAVMESVVRIFSHDNRLLYTDFQKEHFTKFTKEFSLQEKTIEECILYYPAEVIYFHHGLRFANKKIKNYVCNKDILDIGAYDGNSFLIFRKYTNRNIYCFEFSPKNIEKFYKKMKEHKISKGFTLIQKGASSEKKAITIFDIGGGSVSIYNENVNNPVQVELTTIDEEAKNYNMHVGFIKSDVEGHGLHVVKGAINTIKKDRPVLSLSIYHNIEEFFEIKPFLEKHLDNYVYEFQSENFFNIMSELTLFCYPKEIIQ